MKKLNVGNNNLTFKEKVPLDHGITCATQSSIHRHFQGMTEYTRRIYLDSHYALSTHCQRLDKKFEVIMQQEMDRINKIEVAPRDWQVKCNIKWEAPISEFYSEKSQQDHGYTDKWMRADGWIHSESFRGWTKQTAKIVFSEAVTPVQADHPSAASVIAQARALHE